MDEAKPGRSLEDVLQDAQRLRKAAEDAHNAYLQISKKIKDMDARIKPMADGTVRVKPKE